MQILIVILIGHLKDVLVGRHRTKREFSKRLVPQVSRFCQRKQGTAFTDFQSARLNAVGQRDLWAWMSVSCCADRPMPSDTWRCACILLRGPCQRLVSDANDVNDVPSSVGVFFSAIPPHRGVLCLHRSQQPPIPARKMFLLGTCHSDAYVDDASVRCAASMLNILVRAKSNSKLGLDHGSCA